MHVFWYPTIGGNEIIVAYTNYFYSDTNKKNSLLLENSVP